MEGYRKAVVALTEWLKKFDPKKFKMVPGGSSFTYDASNPAPAVTSTIVLSGEQVVGAFLKAHPDHPEYDAHRDQLMKAQTTYVLSRTAWEANEV